MSPTIKGGNVVVIDQSVTSVVGSGIYLIQVGAARELRRIQPMVDGSLDIRIDNLKRSATEPAEADKLTVYGKVIATLALKIIR